jgi:hypothetical protein
MSRVLPSRGNIALLVCLGISYSGYFRRTERSSADLI